MPRTYLTVDRYLVYALHPDVVAPYQHVLCLSTTATAYRYPVTAVTFLPLIPGEPYADRDPYRVPLLPASGARSLRLPRKLYAAVDAVQSADLAALHPVALGRISTLEEREVTEKLSAWLGLTRDTPPYGHKKARRRRAQYTQNVKPK